MKNVAIKLENVSMYYNSNNNITIGISGISLEFFKGEFVAITGESGSGKTSLINVIGASLPYHDGEIYYDGMSSSHFDDEERESFRRDRIGYVCQNYNLIDSYTVLQNVMASMIIGGSELPRRELKKKALYYLDKVGIRDIANSKSSKISSGQKQRLAIARALAKETDIILADEPTGNLDVENGIEIIKILKDLSKDHLVIMVTHNIEEARDYVSRIIRLSDGHVVSDEEKYEVTKYDSVSDGLIKEVKTKKVAWSFSSFNRFARPKRSILLSLFIFIVSLTCFVFVGVIIGNLDDTLVKEYNNSAFYNEDMTRIVVRKKDGSSFSDKEVNEFYNINYVMEVDKYDLVNEANYYVLGEDVRLDYVEQYVRSGGEIIQDSRKIVSTPNFLNRDHFVKSISCIKSDRIIAGFLPTKVNEIMIVGKKEDIGKELDLFFQIHNAWGEFIYFSMKMKVVGVCKANQFGRSDQIYFSEIFSKEMSGNYSADNMHSFWYKKQNSYFKHQGCYLISAPLEENAIAISQDFFTVEEIYYNMTNVSCYIDSDYFSISGAGYDVYNYSEIMSQSIIKVDESEEEKYFGHITSNQISVYIEDYAYTDEVLKAVQNQDYFAISSYRSSTIEYDSDKVLSRNITVLICVASLIVVTILTMFVLGAFLNLNKNDYLLLRLLGMNKKSMYYTNYFEILLATVVFFVFALIITVVLNYFRVSIVHSVMKYLSWYHYGVIFIVVMLIAYLTVSKFNRNLERQRVGKRR